MTIYDFSVEDFRGTQVSLSKYHGKVLLVVNTATRCGLTSQYEALEALYKKYRNRGFEVLDFPSNQFLGQAPGSNIEINEFCTLNYGTTFARFAKIDVNGPHADPLYEWLRTQEPEDKRDDEGSNFEMKVKLLKPFAKHGDIKWNFGKFLINLQGNVAGRYTPNYAPEKLETDIEALLKQKTL